MADETHGSRAAALLAPAGPGRRGAVLRFSAERAGGGVGPEAVRRMLRRIDDEKIDGTLELVSAADDRRRRGRGGGVARRRVGRCARRRSVRLERPVLRARARRRPITLDHAALLLGPINPLRREGRPGFRFRVARSAGYGAAPGMVRRCLERLDDEGIPGDVRVLEAMSDSHHVGTQGPVWYVAGKAV